MKLHELAQKTTPVQSGGTPTCVVFKVSSPNTDKVYYGYSIKGDVERTFLAHAGGDHNADPDRGDGRMIHAAGGTENLRYSIVDAYPNEIEAFVARNDARVHDSASITGPSMFPGAVFKRASAEFPDRVRGWSKSNDLNSMTARDAMNPDHGGNPVYKYQDIKDIVAATPDIKRQLINDLDQLTYPAFVKKYFSPN